MKRTPGNTLPPLIAVTAAASGALAAGAGMLYAALFTPHWHGFFNPILLIIINICAFALLGLIGGAVAALAWWFSHRLGAGVWTASTISAVVLALALGGIYAAVMSAFGPLLIVAAVAWAVVCQVAVSVVVIRRTTRNEAVARQQSSGSDS